MNRNHWFILLGIVLALVFCCCSILCAATGFLWGTYSLASNTTTPPMSQEPSPALDLVRRQPTSAEHQTAHRVAQSTLPKRDLFDLAYRLQGLPEPFSQTSVDSPPNSELGLDYKLGDPQIFWLHNVYNNFFYTTTATLRYETPHAYWWVETDYQVPEKVLEQSAENFENGTYPTNHRYFGSEWSPGVDGDPHVYIFLGYVPGVGGYFSGPDEYPVQIRPHSNEHEMFYINLDNSMPGNDYFDGILAHELQHMIHWAIDRNEDTWVNEGLSELAAQVNGYDVGGSDYLFSLSPDTQLTTWPGLEDSAPHYGASYLFLAYFMDRYGEQAVRKLVAEPANGIVGFDAVLADIDPASGQFEDLFADWLIANYLDDPELEDGRFGYADLDIPQPVKAAQHSTYPVRRQTAVHQYAADYILLESEGDLTIEFTGTQVAPLMGNQVHSGNYQWWSNRGDEGDATLTRPFDLTGLEQATLQVWMWYDLEIDYDYAYVEVSTDNGETWNLLPNEHTTTTNPSGNSYGPALTGISGGGDEPRWVQETFDLTPYAGQPILLRFEVITDDAVNYSGLCLDDITIPELDYFYDAEGDQDGWQAAGWLRITDQVPQEFLVQLITIGRETRVQRMSLDEQMHGTLTINGLEQNEEHAVLVVSALAASTTEWAAYAYRVTQQ